jgi:hypothetical protein
MGRWLREFSAALVVALSALVLAPTSALAVPQVFLAGDAPLEGNTTRPLQPLPVLFVHGHKPDVSILVARSSDPTVTITVAGARLYRGALSGLPRAR